MTKRMNITNGPDRFELLTSFGLRQPVEFETENGKLTVMIGIIEHEDGSGLSFNLKGYDSTEKDPFRINSVEIYYHTQRRSGAIMIMK